MLIQQEILTNKDTCFSGNYILDDVAKWCSNAGRVFPQ